MYVVQPDRRLRIGARRARIGDAKERNSVHEILIVFSSGRLGTRVRRSGCFSCGDGIGGLLTGRIVHSYDLSINDLLLVACRSAYARTSFCAHD
jgi:hypothetical protein